MVASWRTVVPSLPMILSAAWTACKSPPASKVLLGGTAVAVCFDPVGRPNGCAGYRLENNVVCQTGAPLADSPHGPPFDNLIKPSDGSVGKELVEAMEAQLGPSNRCLSLWFRLHPCIDSLSLGFGLGPINFIIPSPRALPMRKYVSPFLNSW